MLYVQQDKASDTLITTLFFVQFCCAVYFDMFFTMNISIITLIVVMYYIELYMQVWIVLCLHRHMNMSYIGTDTYKYYSATGDKDFESIQSTLVFDGDHLEHKIPIAIYDNSIRETVKTFSVQLSLISGVRTRLMPSAMNVIIEEDDAVNGTYTSTFCYMHLCTFILSVYASVGKIRV